MSCLGQRRDTSRFDLFTSLPAELRLQIWNYNNPEPRVVPFRRTKHQDYAPRPEDKSGLATQSTAPAALPSNLHACHESRTEALRFYSQLYKAAGCGYSDFFDCARDILLMDALHSLPSPDSHLSSIGSLVSPHAVSSIRNIAITEAVFSDIQATSRMRPPSVGLRTEDVLRQLCTWLPSLQHIIIVHPSSHHSGERSATYGSMCSYDGAIYLVNPPVRYRFTERRLQNALDVVALEAGTDWARPAWSIQTLGTRPSTEISATMARKPTNTTPPQILPPSTFKRNDEARSLISPHRTSLSLSSSISPQYYRPRWTFADIASTRSSILDYASSRLAFYQRHHYWA